MRRFLWIFGLVGGVALLLILFHFINRERMGNVYDLAYDPTSNRLYAVAGDRGVYTFTYDDDQLKRQSRFHDQGFYRNLEIQGDLAYIAEEERGLVILDISADKPRFVSALSALRGRGLHLAGGLLYLAAGEDGLIIYSLADPDSPQEIGRYPDLEDAGDVTVEGSIAYVTDESRGLEVIDVSSPTQPSRLGFISWNPVNSQAEVVRSEAGFAYVAAGQQGLKIIDARNPGIPVLAAEYKPGADSVAQGLAIQNWILYLTIGDEEQGSHNGLHVLDVRNPYNPQVASITTFADRVEGVIQVAQIAFVANPWSGIRAYAVADPTAPQLIDRFRLFP